MTSAAFAPPKVLTGLEILKQRQFAPLRGLKVGLLTNASAVDAHYVHLEDLLFEAQDCGVRIEALFGPEHGYFGVAQDMIGVQGERSARSHAARIVSLYGSTFDSLKPREEDMKGLDALVFDIQDVGARYYTYVWTLALAMETAARTGTRVIVLDRPNPITGLNAEGGGLDERLRSFVGWREIPNRHAMTPGEIACLAAETIPGAAPEVIRLEGWRRSMWFEDCQCPWVLPSPNMPTTATALVYPGQCLLEGTNLSEGRGTTRPFEIFGAPYVDGRALSRALEAENLEGVHFRPLRFRPAFHKWAGRECGGLQIHVTSRESFRPYAVTLAILRHVRALWPHDFHWRTEPYEFRADVPAIDLLAGSPRIREAIDAGAPAAEIIAASDASGAQARKNREKHLLYPE